MSTCKNCLYKKSHPFGLFIKDTICSGCTTHKEKYEINWINRVELLKNRITKITKKNKSYYDCVIPYSGDAEDYHVVNIVLDLGLNPLMVSINDYFLNDIGWHNSHNLITYFDLDSYNFNPEISAYKELVELPCVNTHMLYGQALL